MVGGVQRSVYAWTPSPSTPWPRVAVTPSTVALFERYAERHGPAVRAVFYWPGPPRARPWDGSYPPGFIKRYIEGLRAVNGILRRHAPSAVLYYMIPDVPGELAPYPVNVARTLDYIRAFRRLAPRLPGTPVPPVQGAPGKPSSPARVYIDHLDVYGEYGFVALARVSKGPSGLARSIALFDHVARQPFHVVSVNARALGILRSLGLTGCRLASITATETTAGAASAQELLDSVPCTRGIVEWIPETVGDAEGVAAGGWGGED